MEANEVIILVILFGAGMWLLVLSMWLFSRVTVGAVNLFAMACEQGFIGIIVYFAALVFLLPVMLILCAISGWLILSDE